MTQTPRISLSFGAFACELEGIADPLPLLQRLVTFCEEVEQRNPDFGKTVVPLAQLREALSTTGPVQAEVRQGRLVLTQPVAPEPEQHGADIRSVEDIESKAVDLPDDALSSALDRAMQQTAQRDTGAARPILSLAEYARARRPRRIQDALEITAAYAHHMLSQDQFDGVKVLTDVDQIDFGKPCTMDEKIEAFGELLNRGTFKTASTDNMFSLSRAVSLRYR